MPKGTVKDFKESAENLTNPDEVKYLLENLHQAQAQLSALQDTLEESNAELVSSIRVKQGEVDAILLDLKGDKSKDIEGAIEKHGSFQDLNTGDYAIRYRRMMRSFHVPPFKKWYQKYVSAVVVETINVQALNGLIKGKLLTEEDLKKHKVITEEAQYAYYVR